MEIGLTLIMIQTCDFKKILNLFILFDKLFEFISDWDNKPWKLVYGNTRCTHKYPGTD